MPCQQQGDQLVAQFAIAERLARFVAGRQQQGEDVLGVCVVGIGSPSLDLLVEQPIDAIPQPDEAAPWTVAPQVLLKERQKRAWRRKPREHALELRDSGRIGDAEDGPDDDLQRYPLRNAAHANRLTRAPRLDRAARDLLDQVRVVRDRLAVKRRQGQLAHPHVPVAVQQEDRRRPGDGFHHLPRLADVVLGGLPLEHLLDELAIGYVEQLAGDRIVGTEDLSVALAHDEPRPDRPQDTDNGLQRRGNAWSRDLGGGGRHTAWSCKHAAPMVGVVIVHVVPALRVGRWSVP